jgi:hypothetical protein
MTVVTVEVEVPITVVVVRVVTVCVIEVVVLDVATEVVVVDVLQWHMSTWSLEKLMSYSGTYTGFGVTVTFWKLLQSARAVEEKGAPNRVPPIARAQLSALHAWAVVAARSEENVAMDVRSLMLYGRVKVVESGRFVSSS